MELFKKSKLIKKLLITKNGKTYRTDVCNTCFAVIHDTWDHHEWCTHYEQETLLKWLEDGENARTRIIK